VPETASFLCRDEDEVRQKAKELCAACRLSEFRTERPSLWLILRRVWQRTFVLGHLSKIAAAVDPPAAGWATDEVIGLTRGWIAKTLAQELPLRKTEHR
jgi:hypothetical protein